jgi:hypothetical protein
MADIPEYYENAAYVETVPRPEPPAVYREDPDAQVLSPNHLPDGSTPDSLATPSNMATTTGSSMGVGADISMSEDNASAGMEAAMDAGMGAGMNTTMGTGMGTSVGMGADVGSEAAAAASAMSEQGLGSIEPFAGSEFGAY